MANAMAQDMYVVHNGESRLLAAHAESGAGLRRLSDDARLWRDDYGTEWIAVEARDHADALDQADLWDADAHPAQAEMALFAAAYRAGALDLARRDE